MNNTVFIEQYRTVFKQYFFDNEQYLFEIESFWNIINDFNELNMST